MHRELASQPDALIHLIVVTQSRLPGCTVTARPTVSALVTTLDVAATPIMNPVSSKLYTSCSSIPYLWRVSSTSLNHAVIVIGSSHFARCEWNFLFHFVCNSDWLLTKRDTQFLPTGGGGGYWPRAASKASATRHTSIIWGGKPRRSRSRIH